MSASIYSIQTLVALALTFVLFHKSAAGRQNRWECEEQSSEAGTDTFCDQASAGGDNYCESPSDEIFVSPSEELSPPALACSLHAPMHASESCSFHSQRLDQQK